MEMTSGRWMPALATLWPTTCLNEARCLPKGKRIDSYDEDAILGVELWANGLPRKILGYRTPDEAFEAEMDRIFAV